MIQKTFQYQAQTIHYRDTGSGTIVVLVHGFGEDSHIWDQQIEHLASHCRLIVPDLPGSGLSQMAPGDMAFFNSVEAMASCVEAMVKSISSEPVILLGHSMGGYIALSMAENSFLNQSPEAIHLMGWGLVHSTAAADSEEKKANRRKAIAHINTHGAQSFLQTAIPGLFGETFKNKSPEIVEAWVQKGTSFTAGALTAYYEAMIARPDRTHVLQSSGSPVLFILGKEDKAVPMEDVLNQVSLPTVSYVHVLDSGHMSMVEATAILNPLLLQFLRDIEKG